MTTKPTSPYTVTSKHCEPRSDWSNYTILNGITTVMVLCETGPGRANRLAALLNDAYQAGVKAASGYETTLPLDTPERRAAMATWAAKCCPHPPSPSLPRRWCRFLAGSMVATRLLVASRHGSSH